MVVCIESDVLVLGTGGAGLRAAIEAEAQGAKVIAVSKSPAGMNNATAVAGGGFRVAIGSLTPEDHVKDTIKVGKEINNRHLVEILAREGGDRVLGLRQFGVELKIHQSGVSVGNIPSLKGLGLTGPLVNYLKSRGVRFFDNVIVTSILTHREAVVGAVGYDVHNDQPLTFSSNAIILATGGAGALYKRTDCPLRTTGDGYSLAYRAGARLRDMEFVQFFPLGLAEPGIPPYLVGGYISEEGRIINSLGEDLPWKYSITARPLTEKSRDLLSRAIMIEILEGRSVDGKVLVDATEVFKRRGTKDLFSEGPYHDSRDPISLHNRLKAAERPFHVAPICHFCMGGVIIDEHGRTDIPGLYAAGEVVGGVHGANRYGGNALTETIVFGQRAGAAAAAYTKTKSHISVDSIARTELKRYETLRSKKANEVNDPSAIMSRLRELMWLKVGIIRNELGLKEALAEIKEYKKMVPMITTSRKDMLMGLEAAMAIDTTEMIIRSAMRRKESRGAHYRNDYPQEDRNWMKTVTVIRNKDGKMHLLTKSAQAQAC